MSSSLCGHTAYASLERWVCGCGCVRVSVVCLRVLVCVYMVCVFVYFFGVHVRVNVVCASVHVCACVMDYVVLLNCMFMCFVSQAVRDTGTFLNQLLKVAEKVGGACCYGNMCDEGKGSYRGSSRKAL